MPDIAVPDDVHDAKRDRVLDVEVGKVVAVELVVDARAGVEEDALDGGEVSGSYLGVLLHVTRAVARDVAGEVRLLRFLQRPQRARRDAAARGRVVDGALFGRPAAVVVARGRGRSARVRVEPAARR